MPWALVGLNETLLLLLKKDLILVSVPFCLAEFLPVVFFLTVVFAFNVPEIIICIFAFGHNSSILSVILLLTTPHCTVQLLWLPSACSPAPLNGQSALAQ